MTLCSALLARLPQGLPGAVYRIGTPPAPEIVFPAIHPEVGDVAIHDDGDELTVVVGRFTHDHFACYRDLPEPERSHEIVDTTLQFLADLFADRIVFWGTHGIGGGMFERADFDGRLPADAERLYVWSGPLPHG